MLDRKSTIIIAMSLVIIAIMLAGCPSPKITRRYSSAKFSLDEVPSRDVTISLFSTEVPVASAQTTILNFSERAQASLIRELSAKVKDAPSLLKALASPVTKPKPQQRMIDRTVVERRVIMSIDNRSLQPSTRIHKAAMILSLASANADFKTWSQFATKYQTINLGSVKFNQTNEFGLGVKAAPPQLPELAEITGSATATRTLEESLNINQRFVEATGVLTAKEARLIQEGAFGIDLAGNMVVDITVSVGSSHDHQYTDIFTFDRLFDDAGRPNAPELIEVDRQTVIFVQPAACQPVKAMAELKATLRMAQKGHRTLIEGDDKALYQPITTTPQPFELVPAEALRFSVWLLVDPRERPLHIERPSGNPTSEALQFGNFDEASSFLLYLRDLSGDMPLSVKGRTLLLNEEPLLRRDIRRLRVEQQRLNWDESHRSIGSRCAMIP
jgi:hypothetical protein